MKFVVAALIAVGSFAFAEEKVQDLRQELKTDVATEKKTWSPILGFKMTMDSGRSRDFSDGKGLTAKSKNELWVGAKHQSGWGAYYNGAVTTKAFRDRSSAEVGDPSIAFIHPTLYDDGRIKQTGYMKIYYPVSDRSRDDLIYQYSLYFNTDMKAALAGFDMLNIFTPRYFDDRSRKASNTHYSFEDWTFLSRKGNNWLAYGIGHWTQYEAHFGTSPGFSSEIFPYLDITVGKKSFISPRLFLPIVSKNSVYDGPKNATLSEARVDLYVYLSI